VYTAKQPDPGLPRRRVGRGAPTIFLKQLKRSSAPNSQLPGIDTEQTVAIGREV